VEGKKEIYSLKAWQNIFSIMPSFLSKSQKIRFSASRLRFLEKRQSKEI
jgi:hypothetical protein